jgi:predicted nucleic acid-binding protein
MGLQMRLLESAAVLVADASVAINLNASGSAQEIIAALPERIIIIDIVVDELEDGRRKGRRDADGVRRLVADGLVEVKSLGQAGLRHLEGLVVGSARDTLDDGEAATIAYAVETGAVVVIDERKAIRICAGQFPKLGRRSTVDIFAHSEVQRALGQRRLADAVFNSLQSARMHVLPHRIKWVVDLIGSERAANCLSLPSSARGLEQRC